MTIFIPSAISKLSMPYRPRVGRISLLRFTFLPFTGFVAKAMPMYLRLCQGGHEAVYRSLINRPEYALSSMSQYANV